jgi:hypothetical protein
MAHKKLCLSLALGASFIALNGGAAIANDTTTPIKHVIVLIGENRTFDNVYATYKAKSGESVENLLSKGIVKEDGSPGPNFTLSQQFQVNTPLPSGFFISSANKTLYSTLPVPDYGGRPQQRRQLRCDQCRSDQRTCAVRQHGFAADSHRQRTVPGSLRP